MSDLFLTVAKGIEAKLEKFKFLKSRRLLQRPMPTGWQGIAVSASQTCPFSGHEIDRGCGGHVCSAPLAHGCRP